MTSPFEGRWAMPPKVVMRLISGTHELCYRLSGGVIGGRSQSRRRRARTALAGGRRAVSRLRRVPADNEPGDTGGRSYARELGRRCGRGRGGLWPHIERERRVGGDEGSVVSEQTRLPANDATLEVVQALGVCLLDEYHDRADQPDYAGHPIENAQHDKARDARDQPQQG